MTTAETRQNILFDLNTPGILNVLAALSHEKSGWTLGLTLDQITKQTGLDEQQVLRILAELEQRKICGPHTCQEGTAGPFAIRYWLMDGVEIALNVTRPPSKTPASPTY